MFKKVFTCMLMVSLIITGTINITYAQDYEQESQVISKDEINNRLRTFSQESKSVDLNEKTIKSLEQRIKRGELLDSEKEDSRPISVREYTEDSKLITEERFDDGSFILTEVTDHDSLMEEYEQFLEKNKSKSNWTSFISNSGTVVSSTSYHTTINGAKVRKSHGAYWAGFSFDYSTYRKGNSKIHRVYGAQSIAGGGTMSLSSPRIIQGTATITSPARAEMDFTFSGYGGVGSYSGVVGITAGNNNGSGGIYTY
ncbi:hypothetical protein L0P54_00665 [Anaerosalibacter bizertensis]|uniref:Uncharacterized protein n=1 Tax=Anaerosalibacter bizertensis TaxID=932217 RepID=A0A9Q4AB10_9FIRM|nr:hypothetical protein [Anaerosalibacter bizertensis]MBV1817779.1 hypothetical protein [Bacteroidales bacterium MSK.15.36]MCB5559040.1 hypothetical protein [Anaerosalibacter bizertensis]MCG4564300.1 hypothetical protein [Anaerosalibacter bizertensis]MCG4581481.1 hypothetical protein [Anaerosalibacter bizertensis]MCG4584830.1 hypothetical protein [Anaerosalibacter bizertensis]